MDLPLLLAGPIARRLTSDSFAVWVATSAATAVRLSMWPGAVSAGTGSGVFDPGGEAAVGGSHTIRVGARLHIAVVVVATASGGQSCLPASATPTTSRSGPTRPRDRTLTTSGRCSCWSTSPGSQDFGYSDGVLPSIVTCPVTIDDLALVHGSCNRIEALGGPNLMFAIDRLIEESLNGVPGPPRPHQLWLTGDQVYSDEIAAPLSPWLTTFGRDLIGVDELIDLEPPVAADEHDPGTIRVPLDQATFPAGYRQRLMNADAKLTTTEGMSHLLGMTERVAMRVFLWSPVPWQRFEGEPPAPTGTLELPTPQSVLPSNEPPLLEALEDPPPHLSKQQIGDALVHLATALTSSRATTTTSSSGAPGRRRSASRRWSSHTPRRWARSGGRWPTCRRTSSSTTTT